MDLDAVLNYEEECFQDGFERGKTAGVKQGHIEGRELGIQTGYQKFLSMGVLQARIAHWQAEGVANLDGLAETVATPTLENTLAGVEDFDRRLRLAKNKCRAIASATSSPAVHAHEQKIMYQQGNEMEDMF